eukprot:1251301-Rhodomonas_salina.1
MSGTDHTYSTMRCPVLTQRIRHLIKLLPQVGTSTVDTRRSYALPPYVLPKAKSNTIDHVLRTVCTSNVVDFARPKSDAEQQQLFSVQFVPRMQFLEKNGFVLWLNWRRLTRLLALLNQRRGRYQEGLLLCSAGRADAFGGSAALCGGTCAIYEERVDRCSRNAAIFGRNGPIYGCDVAVYGASAHVYCQPLQDLEHERRTLSGAARDETRDHTRDHPREERTRDQTRDPQTREKT